MRKGGASAVLVAVIAAGVVVGCGGKAKKRPTRVQDAELSSAEVAGEPGVYADHIVFASTATFNGPNASWGADTWRGAQAYFDERNAAGGIRGREVRVVAVDDGYKVPIAMTNLRAFVTKNDFFQFFDFVGSNIMIETVAELDKLRSQHIYQFASIASTSKFRIGDAADRAFSVRAPISLEMKEAVDVFLHAGKRKMAVFHQDDAYGKSGLDGVVAALAAHGLQPVAITKHAVEQKFDESTLPQVTEMRSAGAEVVFDIGNYQAAAALVRDARESKWSAPIVNNASINDAFVRTLLAHERRSKTKLAYNIVGVKVVPSPSSTDLALIADYRRIIDRRWPQLPADLTDPNYYPTRFSFQSVEGFVNARLLAEVIDRMGARPRREDFQATAEAIHDLDIGLGTLVGFSATEHTALHKVWLYELKDGDWRPFLTVPVTNLIASKDKTSK